MTTSLTDAQQSRALERYALLRPVLEAGVPLASVAQTTSVAYRTLQRWLAQYRHEGLAGLVRQERADQGQPRGIVPELQLLIEGLALQSPQRTVASIHRLATHVALEQGWRAPSYAQVYALVGALPPNLTTLALEGTKAYEERFDLVVRREAAGPNAVWQADHTQLDLWVRDENDAPIRPWLTIILDDYSRAVAGYYLSLTAPSALGTSLALRQAIWRKGDPHWPICGIPATFYTDHGADFTSRHLEQVAADLHITLTFSLPGKPRGRGKIERFFSTVNQLFLCEVPGYFSTAQHPPKPHLTLAELDAQLQTWIVEAYLRTPHRETHQSPRERWEADGFLPRLPESLEHLDALLVTVAKARKIHGDGIHFEGHRYLDTTLAAYVGEEVTIRYDPRDIAEIRVFYHDQFLCRAICPDLAGQTMSLRDILRARNQQRHRVRAEVVRRAEVVERLLGMKGSGDLHAAPETAASSAETPLAPLPPKTRLKRYAHE